MSRAFGMLVTTALPAPRQPGRIVLVGPTIGIAPDNGSPLIARGALGGTERMAFAGLEGPVDGSAGVVVALDVPSPLTVTGGVVFEEGVACRVFAGRMPTSEPPFSCAARFDLQTSRAYGLVRLEGALLTAFVIGGGLPLDADLWPNLSRIVLLDGRKIERSDVLDTFEGWPVEAWAPREEDETLLVTRPCGPAEIGSAVRLRTPEGAAAGEVVNQQPRGLVQVRGPRGVKRTVVMPYAA